MRIARVLGIILLTLLPIYIGSYVVLSLGGCYEPAAIGLDGVKSYGWAPCGFVAHYNWRRWPMIVYGPLHFLDTCTWHTEAKSNSGRYSVDEVTPENIAKVYEARGLLSVEERPATGAEESPK